jgi:cytochrome c
MSAHPQLSIEEVTKAVDYILSLKQMKNDDQDLLPLEGVLTFKEHLNSESKGNYVLSASYIEKGNKETEDAEIPVSEYVIFKSETQESEEVSK